MKKFLSLLFTITVIASCSDDDPAAPVKKLDPMARIQLNLKPSATKSQGDIIPGTWVTDSASFMSRWGLLWSSKTFVSSSFGHSKDNYLQYRDTINNKLFMSGWNIIDENGVLNTRSGGVFDEKCIDNVLAIQRYPDTMYPVFPTDINSKQLLDTIGYIPNKVFEQAKQATIDAYNAGDVDKCYEIFTSYFYFTPITGEQWRALKAAGIE